MAKVDAHGFVAAPRAVTRYLTLGAAVYLLLVLVNFPADLATHWFVPEGVQFYDVRGSAWSGTAGTVATPDVTLEETEWSLSPW